MKTNELTNHEEQDNNERLLCAAISIVNDFIYYGETLQSNDNAEYGPDSPIYELAKAINDIQPGRFLLDPSGMIDEGVEV